MNETELTGLVITECRAIENALRERGAEGSGLRELVESKPELLTEEARTLLRWIGGIRNRVAHEGMPDDGAFDDVFFAESCRAVRAELEIPVVPSTPEENTPEPAVVPDAPEFPWHWIPLLQWAALGRLLFRALVGARTAIFGMFLGLEAAVLAFFPDWRPAAAAAFATAYGLGLIEFPARRPFRWMLWIPGMNFVYFALRVAFCIRWKCALAAVGLLLLAAGTVALFFTAYWRAGILLLIAEYPINVLFTPYLRRWS